jgi:hypothetical protein
MIKIEHIKAHLPFKNCELSFMLRRKEPSNGPQPCKLKLTEDYVDIDVNCALQLGEFSSCQDPVELCAIAVKDGEKVLVGSVEVSLAENMYSGEAPLGGVKDQEGFLAYSLIRDYQTRRPPPYDPFIQKPKKQQGPRGFIKYKNSSSSTYS